VNSSSGFLPRQIFRLRAAPSLMAGCCNTPVGQGYGFVFRDHGRDFYAYIYAARRSVAKEAVGILNTLRFSP
jgi:hypothetical protein